MDWRRHPRLFRFLVNLFPPIRGTGVRLEHIEPDWSGLRVRLPLNLRTRNYVGTIFGGSLYGSVDPWYMILLMHRLGDDYIVWDKSASIRFRRPGRNTLWAECLLGDEEVETIQEILKTREKVDRTYKTELKDRDGIVHAEVEKVVQIRRKTPPTDP